MNDVLLHRAGGLEVTRGEHLPAERVLVERAPEHLRVAVMRLARGEQIPVDQALRREIKADMEGTYQE